MLKRQFLSFLLILSLLTPFFYLPYQAKKAQAFLGFGDLVIDVKALAERIVDGIAMTAARLVVDRMVASTVDWARNGFEGNPAYVKDPGQYFTDLADGVLGQVIYSDEEIGFLCSPFRESVKISIINQYYQPKPFQCTLTDIGSNIEDFYDDFTKGGWDTWFEMTQNPVNNPYGAYLVAQIEISKRLEASVSTKQGELDRNQGFMSWSSCEETNPPAWIDSPAVVTTTNVGNPGTGNNLPSSQVTVTGQTLPSRMPNPKHIPGKAVGECIKRGPVQTPGTTIKAQLDKVLPSGLEKLISVEHVEQLVSAVAAGLLQKYVFGPKGLFARDNGPDREGGTNDIDGDGTPDGLDSNGDGTLDICYFGGADGNPNSKPCLGSRRAGQTETAPGGGGGGEEGVVTGWAWNDHGGPAFQSSKCPNINPRDYFFSLIGDKSHNDWQGVLGEIEGGLWSCGIGQQRTSGGEARGRLFLPTAACPDASPDATDAILGVRQDPVCWAHEVDVLEITVTNTPPPENFTP